MFTSKCGFRHSGMHFFDIRTSKSALGMRCFVHFHFRMYLSPQGRAFFQHQNLQKWSKHVMFCTFSLPNVPFATGACIFSTSELQKVLRRLQFFNIFTSKGTFRHSGLQFFDIWTAKSGPRPSVFFCIFTSKCAFRHSGVQFLMSPLSTYLRTRRFNRPTFRRTWHTNHWKNTAFRDFSNISRRCIFFLLTFALLHLLSVDLTTLLCFSTVHIVGSFYLNFLRPWSMGHFMTF